ncbi:hypothetical protein Sste5346_003807 [Sporothrix stenoceras]|uniref:BHLH domain-containing protein n=1 Tax=Sporothrix stenoceras TaxID=5173 RepID=A0ABR3ZBA1_9PEZI
MVDLTSPEILTAEIPATKISDDPDAEYAIDSTANSRDYYGNRVTVRKQREINEEDNRSFRDRRAKEDQRIASLRAIFPVAFSIPQEVYTKAAKDHKSLTEAECALLRSRDDLYGRALADPDSLTRGERYQILALLRLHPGHQGRKGLSGW